MQLHPPPPFLLSKAMNSGFTLKQQKRRMTCLLTCFLFYCLRYAVYKYDWFVLWKGHLGWRFAVYFLCPVQFTSRFIKLITSNSVISIYMLQYLPYNTSEVLHYGSSTIRQTYMGCCWADWNCCIRVVVVEESHLIWPAAPWLGWNSSQCVFCCVPLLPAETGSPLLRAVHGSALKAWRN